MKVKALLMVTVMVMLSGCATAGSRNGIGVVYTEVKDSIVATTNTEASKTGEACAVNVLSIASVGDMSIDTAKKSAGITKVASVDYSQFSILGVFAKSCTIVKGE